MFNISFIYQKKQGAEFNLEYFVNFHVPMTLKLLSGKRGFKGVSVEIGLDMEDAKFESSVIAISQYYYDTIEHFMEEYSYHEKEISEDLVNYSNIKPVIQINKVQLMQT
jgi:uncharacterized protein (TIGR02118 family)